MRDGGGGIEEVNDGGRECNEVPYASKRRLKVVRWEEPRQRA